MAIGERIRFIRNLRGMTQKWLGMAVGFSKSTADVRMAQYESGARGPKAELIKSLAEVLKVDTHALTVPDIDTALGLAHTLFALEDLYNLRVEKIDGTLCLVPKTDKEGNPHEALKFLEQWHEVSQEYEDGKITLEAYNYWRYTYPLVPTEYAEAAKRGEFYEGRPRAVGLSATWAQEDIDYLDNDPPKRKK